MKELLFLILLSMTYTISFAKGVVESKRDFECMRFYGISVDGQTDCFEEYAYYLDNVILYKAWQANMLDRWRKDKKGIIEKCKIFGKKYSEYSGFDNSYYACLMDSYADFNRNTKYLEKHK